jgi:hypothetical protein
VRLRARWVAVWFFVGVLSAAQESPAKYSGSERTFSQSVAAVQAALQKLPGGTSGRLPVLDGFVVPGAQPLSSYRHPYYQCEVKVTPAKSGGSMVRVNAKITAWLSSPGHPGYETLESNGRVEGDLLDRLQDALAATSADNGVPAVKGNSGYPVAKSAAPEINAPMPRLPDQHSVLTIAPPKDETAQAASQQGPQSKDLQQEAKNLEEILRNQSHPTNLVAVRKDNTPVLQSPAIDAKVLFLASAEDEFEVLEENPGWVHVRISGLSRGWLRRSTVEMPGDSPASSSDEPTAAKTDAPLASDAPQPAATYSVSSEEVGSFPGDWTPLGGKNVKIISLQQVGTGRITSPQEKKQFAEALFKKEGRGLASETAGMVLMFDAEDGGMVAATRTALDQWNSGKLSEAEFWKQCFMDPPEILGTN